MHVTFIRTPINCLDHVQNDWPRDGILRVQILHDLQTDEKLDEPAIDYLHDNNNDEKVAGSDGSEEVDKKSFAMDHNETYLNLTSDQEPIDYYMGSGYPQPLKDKISQLQMIARAGNKQFNIMSKV